MDAPNRQSIPIILSFALAFWGSSALVYAESKTLLDIDWIKSNITIFVIIIFACVLVLLCIALIKKKSNLPIIFSTAICLGAVFSLMAANNLEAKMQNVLEFEHGKYSFVVEEDQKVGSYYNTCNAKLSNNQNFRVKLQLESDFEEVHAGDIIKANAKFSSPAETQIQNYWQNAICANAKLNNPEKLDRNDVFGLVYKFRNHLISTIRNFDLSQSDESSEAEQLLNAIICGQRIDLNSGTLYDTFKCSGLAHLVAVSGAHLSLVTAILLILLKKLKLKRWLIIFIQSIFIFAYLICAAIPISALRAAFMAYIAIFSFFGKRRPAPLNALGLCIIILISVNAETSVSVSFALSAGSTLGIIIFSSLFEYWIKLPFPKCPEIISGALSLTFAANICSQPLSVAIFTQLPLIAPIANIICTPIFTILCGGGLVASLFAACFSPLLPIISSILLWAAYAISQIMCWCTRFLSSLPYSSIAATLNIYIAIFISLSICFFLYIFWPTKIRLPKIRIKKTKLIISSLVVVSTIFALFILFPTNSQTTLKALDVGQGDSILIQSKGSSFMIDTGNQDNLLKTRLAENGVTHLDGILITHPDDDHCGSLDVIEQFVDVSKVYVANDLPTNNGNNCKKLMTEIKKIVSETNIVKLKVGDKICFGEVEMDIIWPDKYKDEGGNCDSLTAVANIDIGNDGIIESRALLCGDAEKDEIDTMFTKRRIPKIDIYKCGHHGSANALSDKGAKNLSPKVTIISVGAKNRYGHPNSKTIDLLKSTGSKIYRTDMSGTIVVYFNSTSIDISTQK